MAGLRICYNGNHLPSHSTESHVALSLESLGHQVIRIQEGDTPALEVANIVLREQPNLYFHTQTYGLAVTSGTYQERQDALSWIQSAGIPNAYFHLDKWLGLAREEQLVNSPEPWTRMAYVFTADGSSPDRWKELGINHYWSPPGIVHTEAIDGTRPREKYRSDVVYVGSHTSYAHEEHWPIRRKMLDVLRQHYGRRFKCWPVKGAIRGLELNDLYASCKVSVGDSCLAGQTTRYWSDRIPESTGRGSLLVHPYVEGLEEYHPDLPIFQPGKWDQMLDTIDGYLENDESREVMRKRNAEHTRTHHTYAHRMKTILDTIFPA